MDSIVEEVGETM